MGIAFASLTSWITVGSASVTTEKIANRNKEGE